MAGGCGYTGYLVKAEVQPFAVPAERRVQVNKEGYHRRYQRVDAQEVSA